MNSEKQIEEMQNDLIAISKNPIMIDGLEHWSDAIAEELHEKGYRKASEVAEEIFAEIEYLIWQHDTHPAGELTEEIAELKKKYTEGKDTK